MKKNLILFAFLVSYNVFAMEKKEGEIPSNFYKYLYNCLYDNFEKYKDNQVINWNKEKFLEVCNENISYWERRTSPQNYYNKMFGGGSLLGIAGFIGACSYKYKELLNYFVPFPIDNEQSSMIKKLAAGTSVMLSIIGGYYALQGLYDWANNKSNRDVLNRHIGVKNKLFPKDKEKEPEGEESIIG